VREQTDFGAFVDALGHGPPMTKAHRISKHNGRSRDRRDRRFLRFVYIETTRRESEPIARAPIDGIVDGERPCSGENRVRQPHPGTARRSPECDVAAVRCDERIAIEHERRVVQNRFDRVPAASSPCTTMLRAAIRTSRSARIKRPSTVSEPTRIDGTSRRIVFPAGIVTSAPGCGTPPRHVCGSDHASGRTRTLCQNSAPETSVTRTSSGTEPAPFKRPRITVS
jgi:hypothetical protein